MKPNCQIKQLAILVVILWKLEWRALTQIVAGLLLASSEAYKANNNVFQIYLKARKGNC